MNRNLYRLVYSKRRGMVVAVEETASATGKSGETRRQRRTVALFAAALAAPLAAHAQIVPQGPSTQVIQTPNGLPQVNIARPSGAGVSINNYTQFDVQKPGAILNNSSTLVNTQQAGWINGNPNFGPNQSARIIVNQVNSNAPSQLRGFVEVAGSRAEVILSNSAGIQVDGGGFINTSRATLTTGIPFYGADGSLAGYNVTGGNITVSGAGLNATNVDQVDLIARAVQANAAIYAKNLNVIAGSNQVNHGTLQATPIAPSSAAPAVAIDVSQLGGMYANRIYLVGNSAGVGVANAGTIAAQAGDLTLQSDGQLVLSGKTNASGNLTATAASVNNSGTTYAQQNTSITAGGALINTGTIAAQQNTTVNAGSLNSNGTLGAGVNSDGSVGKIGELNLSSTGQLTATGQNVAGGNASISGSSVDLSGSQTGTNGVLNVAATQTFTTSGATVSANQLALSATDLINRGGKLTQTGTGDTKVNVSGTLDNSNGSLQTNSTNLTLAPGALINNSGTITDSGTRPLSISTGSLSNNGGTIATNGALSVNGGAVSNQGGKLIGQSQTALTVASLDNSAAGYIGAQNVSVTDTGAFNNSNGTVEANGALNISAQSIANDAGTISNSGTAPTTVAATGTLTNTQGGKIAGNGDVSVSGGSIDNSNGSMLASGAATVNSGDALNNSAGLIQGNGNVSVGASGAITNVGGEIEANGSATTLTVSGSSLDNSSGRVTNTGTGATTIMAGTITNTNAAGKSGAGVIGGNGDVLLHAPTLSNTQGAQVVAGHNLALDVAQSVNNSGGALSGANNVTLDNAGAAVVNQNGSTHANGALAMNVASLDNTAGKIGNDAGSGGSVSISTGTLANQGGAIGSDQNLTLTTGQLSGDGSIIAGNDGAITVASSYTNTAANHIQANHNLTFTTAGNLTNQGALTAVNALTVNAANVDNQAGADINSASTTVNAANAITNEGRIEGDNVATDSATLTNTATIIGKTVTLAGSQSISNSGAAAVMAAASQLNLYSPGDISNTGGADIFSLGDINIAANGTRDANGLLANRANSVTNDQSTIEAQNNLEVATQTLTNSRPAPVVQTVTTGDSSIYQTKRAKYMACATGNGDKGYCTDQMWHQGYKTPLNATFAAPQVVSEASGPNAVDKVLVVNVNGQQQTIYYNTLTTNADGSVTVNYWDAYDPHVNYDPGTEYATRSDGHKGYQRVEVGRTTTTITQQDQVTSQTAQGQLLAGNNMTLANVGTINNLYSAIAAGGSIQIGSTQQGGSVGNGNYGGTTVNNVSQTLYQYETQNIVSTYAWNEDTGRDRGTVVEPSVVLAPVAIGGTGGTITAGKAVQINATNINNTNVAAANSDTGATGGTLGANQILTGQKVNAPQTVAGNGGALNLTLPTNGLYTYHTAPGASYLIATDPRFTSYTKFISSDYMLGQLGLNPQTVEKRLGDGMYEEQLVRNQITQLTGRVYLQGYSSNEDEYRALMNSGVNAAKEFNLVPGMALTAAQMDALTSDIVWLVNQTVTLPDGTTQQVLAPVVYLAHTHANDLQPTGALIAADDVEIHATGSANNSGTIKGGSQTVVMATDILNRGGSIGSSNSNGTTVVSATNNVVNASGTISGNRVAVLAGNDIINTTLVDTKGVSAVSGDSKVNTGLLGQQGTIASTGDMMVSAGHDLDVHGANITAGGNAQITAGHDINVDTVQSNTSQSVTQNANHHWEENSTTNETSAISAGGSLAMQSGNDTTFKGANVSAGNNLSVVAGGNLTVTTVTDTKSYNNVATDDKTRKEVDRTYDEHAVGTTFTSGGNATLAAVSTDANKGNVTIIGSSVTAGVTDGKDNGTGTVNIAGTGNVTINEGREEHDSFTQTQSKRGSFVSGSTTDTMQDTHANVGVASTVSGDKVSIRSDKDLTVQGSNVVGTNDVNLSAAHNVNITTSQDTQTSDSYYSKREYGFLSGLNPLNQLDGGLQGYTIGVRKTTDAQQATQVTNNGSMIGSLNGNLNISAGDALHVTSSTLHADNDINISAQKVTIDAAQNTTTQDEQKSFSQTAISAGLVDPVITAVQTANQIRKDAGNAKGDARLEALTAATAVLAAKNSYDSMTGNSATPAETGITVSLGTSHSNSSSSTSSNTAVGSTVTAGHNLNITATGAGADSDINVIGSNLSAGNNAALNAQGDINLQAAKNTDSQRSTSSGSSASIGATFGVGAQNGLSFQAGVSGQKGDGNGDDTTWTNTHVDAGNKLTLQSGGDTNLTGADVTARQVVANVAGDLNITSLQDTSHYDSKQASGGASVSVCVPPICYGTSSASVNVSGQKMNSNYASVGEQSGIQAGDGGFQVNVKGNTGLTGGLIASSDKAVQDGANSLTTGTLTHSDIQNQASYSAESVGFSGGYGASGFSAAPPIAMAASGDASSTTRSGVSGGALTITNSAAQQQKTGQTADQAVASVNRDTSNTSNTLAPIFNQDKIQTAFDITSQFVTQAGTFISNRAHEADEARKALDAEQAKPADQQDAAKIAQLTQIIQNDATWEEGGTGRRVLTAIVGAAGGNVAGSVGSMMQSAAAYYLQSLATEQVKGIADALDSEKARTALQSLVGCAGAAAAGSSCGAGAAGAAASVVLNDLMDSLSGTQVSTLTEEEKQARERLVQSIVAGTTSALGGDAATSSIAALIESENNAANFVKGTTPRVQAAATSVADALRKPKGALTRADIDAQLAVLNGLEAQGNLSNQEALNLSSLWMAVVERASAENLMTPQEVVGSKQAMQAALASMMFSGGGDAPMGLGKGTSGPQLPSTTGSRTASTAPENTSSGTANSVSGARLSMQLSAEEAAGVRAPVAISSYSDHALQQMAGRDGGIGVSQGAVDDAFANPTAIQYVPSKYGPTFKYVGQNATVVVNAEGNVVTAWGTSAAGVKK
ncbi:filamentous hemagglutinin N-terminal domain-containing protein [Burkholderia sp. Bp9131]|uniref:hemagglutinin repeat-containing protein n=1 Tax=Burkholderia sp. Bp9131 TaxID=2184571 RepID=UPI000F57B052|nr:hemagglutinin repeat-containing protein [Burkholderia sp. Bp9131]RQR43495.1 filamentous hemagglutinin N-terminal domain-containing protein [Burkholderia sp. Bp9131]